MGDIALRGNRLTAAKGGRIGLRHGGKPWGTGPKPGTEEYWMQQVHKPRKRKALGSIVKGGKQLVKKIIDKIKKGKGSEKGKKGLGSGIKPSEMRETIPTKEGRREYLKVWSPHYGGKRTDYGKKQAEGGRAGLKHGGWKKPPWMGKPSKMGKFDRKVPWRDKKTHGKDVPTMAAEGGRIGFKKGTDKRWMQKVSASIKKRGTKGKCTPITKPGCTGRAKALAKTFKKIAARRKG